MKQFFTLVLSFFFVASSFAQVTAVKSGSWEDNSTWNSKVQPKNGDEVVIPNGMIVEVDDNQKLTSANLKVNIYGTLAINQGQFRIGDNSVINIYATGRLVPVKGNGGEKVIIGAVEKYTGVQGIIYGPLTASKTTTGFQSFTFSVLPVKFSAFSVATQNNNVLVQWSTAEESGAAHFDVQRSTNGTDWASIGRVAAAGNSSSLKQYAFTDKNKVTGTAYYRIQQVDANGQTAYTAIQTIRTAAPAQVSIVAYQNNVALQFTQQVKGKVAVVIVNRAGQVVAQQALENPVGNVTVNTASLKGNYFVTIQSVAGLSASKQVVL